MGVALGSLVRCASRLPLSAAWAEASAWAVKAGSQGVEYAWENTCMVHFGTAAPIGGSQRAFDA